MAARPAGACGDHPRVPCVRVGGWGHPRTRWCKCPLGHNWYTIPNGVYTMKAAGLCGTLPGRLLPQLWEEHGNARAYPTSVPQGSAEAQHLWPTQICMCASTEISMHDFTLRIVDIVGLHVTCNRGWPPINRMASIRTARRRQTNGQPPEADAPPPPPPSDRHAPGGESFSVTLSRIVHHGSKEQAKSQGEARQVLHRGQGARSSRLLASCLRCFWSLGALG